VSLKSTYKNLKNIKCKLEKYILKRVVLAKASKMFLEHLFSKSQDVKFTSFEKNVVKKHLQDKVL